MTVPPRFAAAVFDVDGVLNRPTHPFSKVYAQRRGLDHGAFDAFFAGPFLEALIGRADLIDLIAAHRDVWRWSGDPEALLEEWFRSEDRVDARLMAIVGRLRAAGVPVYVATNQERHRAAYLASTMFPGGFDGFVVSCAVGSLKQSERFWAAALARMAEDIPRLSPDRVVFFDDTPACVASARRAGITALRYDGPQQVAETLS